MMTNNGVVSHVTVYNVAVPELATTKKKMALKPLTTGLLVFEACEHFVDPTLLFYA
ncbi:uncharacterized protein METZ01_LOCUS492207 [marine metagenome]|uniref:Uncharacterized protein n=1 Tax=marine metagenome TaxID=408172 RepID=A0A383D526_9ZZZZ